MTRRAAKPFVYFLRPVGQRGPVKIGYSRNPQGRLAAFLQWSPVDLEIVATTPGDHRLEQRLHGMFRAQLMRSEWFNASDELDALIAGLRAGKPIARLIDTKSPVIKFRKHPPRPAEYGRFRSYSARVRAALRKVDSPHWVYVEPADVAAIFNRWPVWNSDISPKRLPTQRELARLEKLIASPTVYGRRVKRMQAQA